jgi:hypothetical protein
VGSGVLCKSVQRLYLENLNTSRAEFKLEARQFEAEIVAPGEGAPIVVSHCIAMPSLAVR